MDIHVELRYDGFNSVQQIGYTSLGGLFFLLGRPNLPTFCLFLRSGQKGADRFFRWGFSKSCRERGKRRNPIPTSPAPHCGSVCAIDESECAELLCQIKSEETEKEIQVRIEEAKMSL